MKQILFVFLLIFSASGQDAEVETVVQEPFPVFELNSDFDVPAFLDISDDEQRLVLGTQREVHIYDLPSRCLLIRVPHPDSSFFAGAALDPTGRYLVFHRTVPPNYPKIPCLLDIETGKIEDLEMDVPFETDSWLITPHEDVAIFKPTKRGKTITRPLASGSPLLYSGLSMKDGSRIVWNGGDHLELRSKDGKTASINLITNPDLRFAPFPNVGISPENHPIIATQDRNQIHVIDILTDELLATVRGNRPQIDGSCQTIALVEPTGAIEVYDISSSAWIGTFKTAQPDPTFQLSPDGTRLAIWNKSTKSVQDIALPNGKTQHIKWPFEEDWDAPAHLAYSPDGSFLAIAPSGVIEEESLRLANTKSGRNIEIPGASKPAFDPTGRFLAFTRFRGRGTGCVAVFDLLKEEIIYESPDFDLAGFGPDCLTFVNDSQSILIPNGGEGILQLNFIAFPDELPVLVCRGNYISSLFPQSKSRIWALRSTGELSLIDLTAKTEVLRVLPFSNGHVVSLKPNHHYSGRPETLDAIAFKMGLRAWPVEQFDLALNRPHEILEVLDAPSEQVDLFRSAFERRQRRFGLKANEFEFGLPEIEITNRKKIPLSTDKKTVDLKFRATSSTTPLHQILLYLNEVPVEALTTASGTVSAELEPGSNKIQLCAIDTSGAESLRETLFVNRQTDEAQLPDLYLFSIGVSKYKMANDLDVAAKDATDLANLLAKGEGNCFRKVFSHILLDESATRENILENGRFLEQSKVGDQILIFVAGHGLQDANYDYWFATHDIDPENPSKRGLNYDELEGLFTKAPARKRLLIMDTCYAGEVDREDLALASGEKALPSGVSARVVKRSGPSAKNIPISETGRVLTNRFADFRRRTGATVLTGSSGMEFVFALENEELGNGVFTHSLMEGIKTGHADFNGDGKIQVSEWQKFGIDRVISMTEGAQRPTGRQLNRELDFDIADAGVPSLPFPNEWLITEQTNEANGNWRIEWECVFNKDGNTISGEGGKIRVNGKSASRGERKTVFRFKTTLSGGSAAGTSEEVAANEKKIPGIVTLNFSKDLKSLSGTLNDSEGNHISDLSGEAK
ncbi:MAG: caspase family protein [Verrucomicrobiales bacterium]|nr:caspase family protein [Verrucomicrobiales bacterium]